MVDSKAAAEFIRELRKKGYRPVPHNKGRFKVVVGDDEVIIPGPKQRTSGRAIHNARATLRRELNIDI